MTRKYRPPSTLCRNAIPYFARLRFSDLAYRVYGGVYRYSNRVSRFARMLYGVVGSGRIRGRIASTFRFRALQGPRRLQERSLWGQTSRVLVAGVWWSAALRGARSSAGAPAARWGLIVRAGVGGGESELVKIHGGGFASREAAVRRDSSCHAVVYQSSLTIGVASLYLLVTISDRL